ncbi:MAG: hypothetical protein ACRED1_11035 [Limisphaerales bacterium]
METSKDTNGLQTFLEHWEFALLAVFAIVILLIVDFFLNLREWPWIILCFASFALMICGAVLIGSAKPPVYRDGRFFTFGVNSVPDRSRRLYRLGWRLFLFGVSLSACLLLRGS